MTIYTQDPIAEALDLEPIGVDYNDLEDYIENETWGGGGFNFNHTEETKHAISNTLKGRRTTEKVCLRGIERTQNQIKGKIIAAEKRKCMPIKGKNILKGKNRTDAQREAAIKHSIMMTGCEGPNKGKKFSDEWKEKLRGPRPNARKPKPKLKCPHCEKIGGAPQMKRHHFDNCKLRYNG